VNGYAPEKSGILSDYIHFYVLLWTNGHQKEAFSALSATDCSPGILNGYAPEYVVSPYFCPKSLFSKLYCRKSARRFSENAITRSRGVFAQCSG
jgi:hypothetical protein